jgi:hypothetical protein
MERRMARTAATGAVGAIAIGATFGLMAGKFGAEPASDEQSLTGTGLDVSYREDRSDAAASRGLARGAPPLPALEPRGVAPGASPEPEVEGPAAAPLPPTPADCEEYSGNREIGCTLLDEFGFGLEHMPALDNLWSAESGWNELASNPSSGAYGIPQALPGNKMATVAGDWETNPATQIRWGLGYIGDRYGNPTAAWEFFQANGYY